MRGIWIGGRWRRFCLAGLLGVGGVVILGGGGVGGADVTDAVAGSVAKDREAVRGNWRLIEVHVDGQRLADEEARRFSVTNAGDGSWVLLHDGGEFSRGGSRIDPAAMPKAIDFTATDASGETQEHLGIYELGEPTRRICFARPGRPRPVDFSSTADNEQVLVVLQRE